jgi:hypothetical protein
MDGRRGGTAVGDGDVRRAKKKPPLSLVPCGGVREAGADGGVCRTGEGRRETGDGRMRV